MRCPASPLAFEKSGTSSSAGLHRRIADADGRLSICPRATTIWGPSIPRAEQYRWHQGDVPRRRVRPLRERVMLCA